MLAMGTLRHVCSRLAFYARSIAHKYGTTVTSVIRLLETSLYVADLERSYDFYKRVLGLGPDVEITAQKESQKRFRPLQIPGGQVLLLFLEVLPRPRRFFPEARSRHTTAMDGFIWRSPSPPPRSTLGESVCNRTEYQSKARWSGRAAARASTSGIPTVILWNLPRLDCGRSIDERGSYAFRAWVRSCHVTVRAVSWFQRLLWVSSRLELGRLLMRAQWNPGTIDQVSPRR